MMENTVFKGVDAWERAWAGQFHLMPIGVFQRGNSTKTACKLGFHSWVTQYKRSYNSQVPGDLYIVQECSHCYRQQGKVLYRYI